MPALDLNAYLQQLVSEQIISANTAKAIGESADINYVIPSVNRTLLMGILSLQIDPLRKEQIVSDLLALGADPDSRINDRGAQFSVLDFAIAFATNAIVEKLIARIKAPFFSKQKGSTLLHELVEQDKAETLAILMRHPEAKQAIYAQDSALQSPLSMAAQKRADDMIRSMLGRDLNAQEQQLYQYGHPQLYLAQGDSAKALGLNAKLSHYVAAQQAMTGQVSKDVERLIDPVGMCTGWSFLHQLYSEPLFWDTLETLADWDGLRSGTAKSLDALQLTPALAAHFSNAQDLVEHTISALVLFQSSSLPFDPIRTKPGGKSRLQRDRDYQFELLKSSTDQRKFSYLYDFEEESLSRQQLQEMLTLLQSFPDGLADLVGYKHCCSIKITEDGRFAYYDSNIRHRLPPFDSAAALTDFLFNYLPQQENRLLLGFHLHQCAVMRQGPLARQSVLAASTMGFSALHSAVFAEQAAEIQRLAQSHPQQIIARDLYKKTPVDYAYESGRLDTVDTLLACLQPEAIQQLLHNLPVSLGDLGYYILNRHVDKLDFKANVDFIRGAIAEDFKGSQIYGRDAKGRSLLHLAILHQEIPLATLLITKGRFLDSLDHQGQSPRDYARQAGLSDLFPKTEPKQQGGLLAKRKLGFFQPAPGDENSDPSLEQGAKKVEGKGTGPAG